MAIETVRADEVKPGDHLYDATANPAFQWVRVVSVEPRTDEPNIVVIKTTRWDTWKHKGEGVAVRRD